jgi:hypothetical protein
LREHHQEFRRLHRLDQVIVEAGLHRRAAIRRATLSGQRDQPHAAMTRVGAVTEFPEGPIGAILLP